MVGLLGSLDRETRTEAMHGLNIIAGGSSSEQCAHLIDANVIPYVMAQVRDTSSPRKMHDACMALGQGAPQVQ
eukprot:gene2851-31609_t